MGRQSSNAGAAFNRVLTAGFLGYASLVCALLPSFCCSWRHCNKTACACTSRHFSCTTSPCHSPCLQLVNQDLKLSAKKSSNTTAALLAAAAAPATFDPRLNSSMGGINLSCGVRATDLSSKTNLRHHRYHHHGNTFYN